MLKKRRFRVLEYKKRIKQNKLTFAVYVLLRLVVIGAMVVSCLRGNYENLFFCALALVLFLIPAFLEKNFDIDLPNTLEIVIMLFIFAALILGEMGNYYTKYPFWDTILHTVNGFLCAAVGFGMVDILNRNAKITFRLSPAFFALVAFCFSMTIGVLWEFYEYGCDQIVGTDMQKDAVVSTINSTYFSGSTKEIVTLEDIEKVTVNGQELGVGGYLDLGLDDTMKDLIVNFIGAFVFSIIGFFYVRNRGKGKIAGWFIPRASTSRLTEKEAEDDEKN